MYSIFARVGRMRSTTQMVITLPVHLPRTIASSPVEGNLED